MRRQQPRINPGGDDTLQYFFNEWFGPPRALSSVELDLATQQIPPAQQNLLPAILFEKTSDGTGAPELDMACTGGGGERLAQNPGANRIAEDHFGWDFDDYVVRHSRGATHRTSRIFQMLDDMAEDGNRKRFLRERQGIRRPYVGVAQQWPARLFGEFDGSRGNIGCHVAIRKVHAAEFPQNCSRAASNLENGGNGDFPADIGNVDRLLPGTGFPPCKKRLVTERLSISSVVISPHRLSLSVRRISLAGD